MTKKDPVGRIEGNRNAISACFNYDESKITILYENSVIRTYDINVKTNI